MGLNFNMLLVDADLDPRDVRLLRHQQAAATGLTPFALWRDEPDEFERYQSAQRADRRAYFASRYWASFVVPPDSSTLFVGLYEIGSYTSVPRDWMDPLHRSTTNHMRRELDIYVYRRLPQFDQFAGRLKVDWGQGKRSWAQKAQGPKGNKPIIELTEVFREADFPGYTSFIANLASLATVPVAWIPALSAARGVYLLTCPRTREQYVGAAYGLQGFWGRWQSYVVTGHGGNEGLKSRDPSDYQISILEIAGSAATVDDICAMEALWKGKLQSREMGLNRN